MGINSYRSFEELKSEGMRLIGESQELRRHSIAIRAVSSALRAESEAARRDSRDLRVQSRRLSALLASFVYYNERPSNKAMEAFAALKNESTK
jgi:hypothetical protein